MDTNNIAKEVEVAFRDARERALRSHASVLEYSNGYLVRVTLDGMEERIMAVESSVAVTMRTRRIYAA